MGGMAAGEPGSGIGSFVAIGDSFTEGLSDPDPGGGYRGWADRVADVLAQSQPGFRYANLAIRGKLLDEVLAEQLPRAVEMAPDLVGLAAGGNDILRGSDVDTLAAHFEPGVAKLQAAGCRVVIFTGFDPRVFPVIRWLRGRIAAYDMHLRGIAGSPCAPARCSASRSPKIGARRFPRSPQARGTGLARGQGRARGTPGAQGTGRASGTGRSGWPRAARMAAGRASTRCRGCAGG